ncbi:hypothetical protein Gpo141_00009182 [Globisporangium polare]
MREAKATPTTAEPSSSSSDGSGASSADQTPAPAATTTTESDRRPKHQHEGSRASSSYEHAGSSSSYYASSSSSSFSYDPDTVGNDPGWTSEFPCQYYPPDADGCAEYRSCSDCLNGGVIYKGRGCYVNPSGRCLDLASATFGKKSGVDFRNATPANNATSSTIWSISQQHVYFPSRAAKYCAASDPICQKCKRTVFEDVIENDAKDGLSNFCLGHKGCVCVAVCESPSRQDLLGGLMCNGKPQPGHSGSSNQASSQANRSGLNVNANITWLVGIPLLGAIMAVVMVSWSRKNRPRRQDLTRDVSLFGDRPFSSVSGLSDSSESSDGSMNSSMSSIDEESMPSSSSHASSSENGRPQLNLVGWRALRNELITREQQLLAGQQDFSSIGYVQLLDTSSASSSVPPSAASSVTSGDERDSDGERHSEEESIRIPVADDDLLLPVLGEEDERQSTSSVVVISARGSRLSSAAARDFDADVSML